MSGYPKRDGYELGVDVSRWQGAVDWQRLRDMSSATWAICKATESATYVDPTFKTNSENAPPAGITFGGYHFFDPSRDVDAQVELYSSIAEPCCEIRPTLDFETLKGCGVEDGVKRARRWLDAVAARWNCRPIFYSYPGFVQLLQKDEPAEMAAIAQECDLWISHFTRAVMPWCPIPWNKWVAWQFDGDKGLTLPNGVDADFSWAPDLNALLRNPET